MGGGQAVFSVGFAVGLVAGFGLSLVAIRYLEKQSPDQRPRPEGYAAFVPRQKERKKPVVMDEAKEVRIEQERLKDQR